MKKLLAILLVAIMSFTVLVSCGGNGDGNGDGNGEGSGETGGNGNGNGNGETTPPTAESLVAAADAALEGGTYKVNAVLSAITNNEEMNTQMGFTGPMMSMTLTMVGDDFMMESAQGDESYVSALVGNVYYDYETDGTVTEGEKCTFNEAQLNAFLAGNGDMGLNVTENIPLSPEDFATVTLTEADGKYTVVYADLKDEAKDGLGDSMGMGMDFDTVTLTMVFADGKYESFDMVMSVAMPPEATDLTEEIVITVTCDMGFTYSDVAITIPANADLEEVYYEDVAGTTDYDEYVEAELGAYVAVDTFVQGKQSWWSDDGVGKCTIYTQNYGGGFFLYEVELTKEEYDALEVGTHIMVYGFKSAWDGEVEIIDAEIRVLNDYTWIAEPQDVTDLLGTAEIENYRDSKVSFSNMTVVASNDDGAAFLYKWNGAGKAGDDIYFKASVNGEVYTFVIESYLTADGTAVYEAAEALKVGDVINMEAFLYWYSTDAQPHVYSITVANADAE